MYFKKDGSPYSGPNALFDWAKDFENIAERIVGKDELPNGLQVSTVWMGLDHNYGHNNRPLIFESMVFLPNTSDEQEMWRYSTWEEAERGHKMLVKKFKNYKTADQVLNTK